MGLIVASYRLANGPIGRDVFSASVIVVLATTMVTPPLLRPVFPHGARVAHGPVEQAVVSSPREQLREP